MIGINMRSLQGEGNTTRLMSAYRLRAKMMKCPQNPLNEKSDRLRNWIREHN